MTMITFVNGVAVVNPFAPTNLANANVASDAAIALSKLAATTASRALVSDGSGVITPSSGVTAAELEFLASVTSDVQTQLNVAKSRSSITFLSSGAITNVAAALQFFQNTNSYIVKVDLTSFTDVRLLTVRGGAGGASATMELYYKTTYSGTVTDYAAIASPSASVSLTNGSVYLDSGWQPLVAGAKAEVFVALITQGGDGAADPNFGNIVAEFR